MKLKLTVEQFKRLLENPNLKPKYPITIDLAKVGKKQAQEIIDILKKKRN